jgi:hypothetical protein
MKTLFRTSRRERPTPRGLLELAAATLLLLGAALLSLPLALLRPLARRPRRAAKLRPQTGADCTSAPRRAA